MERRRHLDAKTFVFNSTGLHENSLGRTGSIDFASLSKRTPAFRAQGVFLTCMNSTSDPAQQIAHAQFLRREVAGENRTLFNKMQIDHRNPGPPDGAKDDDLQAASDDYLSEIDAFGRRLEHDFASGNAVRSFPPVRAGQQEVIANSDTFIGTWLGANDAGPNRDKLYHHKMRNVLGSMQANDRGRSPDPGKISGSLPMTITSSIPRTARSVVPAAIALTVCRPGRALQRKNDTTTSRFGPGQEALEMAMLAGDRTGIAPALAAGSQVNARDRNQVTPLMLAVDRLRQQAVAELPARGADPNLKAADGASEVSLAIENHAKAPELMLTIIRVGGDPNTRSCGNDPVTMRFINDRNGEALRQVKALGADMNALSRSRTPLVLDAALGSDWDVVWCLLELGAKYDPPPGPPENNLGQMLADPYLAPDSPVYRYKVKVKVRDFLRAKGVRTPPLPGDAAAASGR